MGALYRYENQHGSKLTATAVVTGGMLVEVTDRNSDYANVALDDGATLEFAYELYKTYFHRFPIQQHDPHGFGAVVEKMEVLDERVNPTKAPSIIELLRLLPPIGERLDAAQRAAVTQAFTSLLTLLYPAPAEAGLRINPLGVSGGGGQTWGVA